MHRLLLILVAASACTSPAPPAGESKPEGCLASGDGYLRARIRGALDLDLDWRNAEISCEGGARPDERGIRVSFAGPLQSEGRRLRLVFGISETPEGAAGRALPTNLTVILEGEKRLFATRGDDKCTVDELRQEPFGASGEARSYRVEARGFCMAPATSVDRIERILVSRFDFAGRVVYEDEVER
jgi:hypothetical protein